MIRRPKTAPKTAPTPTEIDALDFSDALSRARYDAAAVLLAVRGYFDGADHRDVRRSGLEKLADHLDQLTTLEEWFEHERQSSMKKENGKIMILRRCGAGSACPAPSPL